MIIKGIEFLGKCDISKFLDKYKKTQIFDVSLFISKRHIEHCIQQALKAFAQKRNISRSVQLEFLLCLTAEKQVKKALEKAQITGKKAVFVSWDKDWNAFKKEFQFKEVALKDKKDLDAMQKSATYWLV